MSTTFRSDLMAGMVSMAQAFIDVNPTLLRRVYDARPESLNTDLPCAFIDFPRGEQVHYDNSIFTRSVSVSLVVVDRLTSNNETSDRFDVLVDALLSWFNGYPHIVASSVWSDLSIDDETQQMDENTTLPAVRFTFAVEYYSERM